MISVSRLSPKGEMSEANLLALVKIFLPCNDWLSQKRFNYDPKNKRRFYKVDCFSEALKTVFEYEGPDHYNDVWKLRRDEERKTYFEDMGYKFFRWPYYLQLTEDVAKHFFRDSFTKDKFEKAFKGIYQVDDVKLILSPGFHDTKNIPANFVSGGTRRFFSELNSLPRSVESQVAETLRRYIAEVDDRYLIIGEEEEFETLIKKEFCKKDDCVFFLR